MSYSPEDLPKLLAATRKIATQAGEAIINVYNEGFEVTDKDDKSPLTTADLASHHSIVDGLKALTSDIPILSEESRLLPFETRSSWETYWLIDPLDGTKEFIKRNGEFTVNIALVHQHKLVLGVVYAPVLGLSYYAAKGHGSFKSTKDGDTLPIKTRDQTPKEPVIAGSRSHAGDSLIAFLGKVGSHELISMGSSLKICLVAEGKADLYPRFGLTSEWDTAAAQCVVEEAGGELTDLDFKQLLYNTKESLLNPHFMVIGNTKHDWGSYL